MSATATFALGCFWGPDDFFSQLPGVEGTRVGYTGGEKEAPTYTSLGDHTEAVEITFDPDQISYQELLEHFWQRHDPTHDQKTQYRSAIFTHGDEQQRLAEQTKTEQQQTAADQILTSIEPLKTFYPAEEYHQKYMQKNRGGVC